MTAYLECLQSAFSLKICLVLISARVIANHDDKRLLAVYCLPFVQEFSGSKITCSRHSDKGMAQGVKVEQLDEKVK